MLGHKVSLSKFKKTEIISSIFSEDYEEAGSAGDQTKADGDLN